jgi:glycosyltransferase involved in cell wall biosynthesis
LGRMSLQDQMTEERVALGPSVSRLNIAHVSTYPPRECGIALYTEDLVQSIGSDKFVHHILAVDDDKLHCKYTHPVSFVINADNPSKYAEAAQLLNQSDCSVVSLQHEYGIFGGDWGRNILEFTRSLQKPLVTTFHTVLTDLPQLARKILVELSSKSRYVVVTIGKAAQLITETYNVPMNKVRVIPHGAPPAFRRDASLDKERLGLSGREIVSTVGFLSPAKGIDCAIAAMKILVEKHPSILYLIVGETHPTLRKHEDEKYRRELEDLIRKLGLAENVMFVDRFVSDQELSTFLNISDVYVAPYRGRDQVSSGTLTGAMAHGKAIVATPTLFANETLSFGRGLFCEYDDAKSIAHQVDLILSNQSLRRKLEVRAKEYGEEVEWGQTAKGYAEIFAEAAKLNREELEQVAGSVEKWIQC